MKLENERYRIAVDFDGVIHSYTTQWIDAATIPDAPVDGAIEWLNEIVRRLDVVVFTTRGSTYAGRLAVREWLEHHGYEGPGLRVTDIKPPALIYLDDRGWRFEGPSTFPTIDEIFAARPWNKQ